MSHSPAFQTPAATASWLPVLALLAAACFWGSVWYPLRLLEAAGLGGLWAVAMVYGSAALAAAIPAWRSRRELFEHPWLLLLLALAGGWTNTAFVLAMLDGNVVRVLLLFYLSPLWSTLLGWWWLGERPSRAGWATLALAAIGAVVMLWRPEMGLPWPQGEADWLSISGGLTFSLSNVLLRRLQHLSEPLRLFAGTGGVLLIAAAGLVGGNPAIPVVDAMVWGGAALLGALGVFLAGLGTVYGVSHMPVHRSAVLLLSELVAGAVSSQLLTDEMVTAREWLGGGLILLGTWLAARRGGEAVPPQGEPLEEKT